MVRCPPDQRDLSDKSPPKPPRRNKPPLPAPPTAAAPKKSASKLAKQLGLDVDEEAEIREAWEMFIDEEASEDVGEYVIPTADVRRAMIALGFESSKEEVREIAETVDPEDEGFVAWGRFLEVAALKMKYRDQKAEVQTAFDLFKGGTEGPITFKDLKRVAGELKENVTDDQLRDMLSEASNSHSTNGVDLRDFEAVMKRAGIL